MPVMRVFNARLGDPPDAEWLRKLFRVRDEKPIAPAVDGPELGELGDVAVQSITGDRDWNAEIWITEAAEAILGEEVFRSLEKRFGRLNGVERIAWEKRERFLVPVARRTDLERLRDEVSATLRAAAGGS